MRNKLGSRHGYLGIVCGQGITQLDEEATLERGAALQNAGLWLSANWGLGYGNPMLYSAQTWEEPSTMTHKADGVRDST